MADEEPPIGAPLLLDTTVYLHVLRGKTTPLVDALLRTRALYHSATAVAELTFRFGARRAASARERAARAQLEGAVEEIPTHRLIWPTPEIWAEAGILAGMRARAGDLPASQQGLNDALILLQARRVGAMALTANVDDFDILSQIAGGAGVVYYREAPTRSGTVP